jgi:hypothetical protein
MCHFLPGLRALRSLALLRCAVLCTGAAPAVSEFMASNRSTIADADGDFSDWIEIYNPDATPINLDGWYLTDNASNKTKWRFPAVTIPAQGYLLVFASDKNRREAGRELHTSFALSADGEYLGLIQPDGVTAASEFAPTFPAQAPDVSYGFGSSATQPAEAGYLLAPTPGTANTALGLAQRVQFEPASRTFRDRLTVSLSGAAAGQIIRYEIAPPAVTGAVAPEPTATSPAYTGPFEIDSSVLIRAAVFAEDNSRAGGSSVAHFIRVAAGAEASLEEFSSSLPVLVLDVHGFGPLEKSHANQRGWLEVFTPRGTPAAATVTDVPALATPVSVKVRGFSSADFPKKSFSVELSDDANGSRSRSMLGLANNSDWALVSPWLKDSAYIRNAYVYALSNRIGRWAPRTKFVELFFKPGGAALDATHYYGISVLTERIKVAPDLVNIAALSPSDLTDPAITGGYILKFDTKEDDEYGWFTDREIPAQSGVSVGTMLIVHRPKLDKLAPVQRDYIRRYVQDFENALFADRASGWATHRHLDYIDRASWIDIHILNILTQNVDGLDRSAYFTKDRGGKLVAGPAWDFDRSMSANDHRPSVIDDWNAHESDNSDLWNTGWWGVITRDPDFMQAWIDRWQSLRRDAFSDAKLTGLADTLASQISLEAAARDVARWPDNESRFGSSFLGEVDNLKAWLTGHASWIDSQFTAEPVMVAEEGGVRVEPPAGLQLAYTLDGTDPRMPGGTLSRSAVVVSEPFTLPPGSKATVRSYNPDTSNAFPGSPWSSARVFEAAASGSAAISETGAFITNLSTRRVIESGNNLLAGVVVGGATPKRFLVRAVGPGLAAFGVEGALADPVLRILSSTGAELARNTDWRAASNRAELAAASSAVGAFALSDANRDAALIVSLPPGSFTLDVSSETGAKGVVLAELYSLETNTAVRNLSTRSVLAPGEQVIGGITISGTEPRRILVRAIGPGLTNFGVTNPVDDPTLAIYGGTTLIASNDDWAAAANAAEIASISAALGAFPLGASATDSAMLTRLNPGSYTLQLGAKGNAGGAALLEVYDVP